MLCWMIFAVILMVGILKESPTDKTQPAPTPSPTPTATPTATPTPKPTPVLVAKDFPMHHAETIFFELHDCKSKLGKLANGKLVCGNGWASYSELNGDALTVYTASPLAGTGKQYLQVSFKKFWQALSEKTLTVCLFESVKETNDVGLSTTATNINQTKLGKNLEHLVLTNGLNEPLLDFSKEQWGQK